MFTEINKAEADIIRSHPQQLLRRDGFLNAYPTHSWYLLSVYTEYGVYSTKE